MSFQAALTELAYRDDGRNSDKYYRAFHVFDNEADVHRVVFQWGRQGSAGQSKMLILHDEGSAAMAISRKLREKTDKGYRIVFDKTLPGVSADIMELAELSADDAVNARSQQDPVKVLLVDIDTCRRLAMGAAEQVTQAVVMRRTLAEQLAALRASVEDAAGQVEVVDMVLGAKLASA